jgi:mannosyltransferase
MTSSVLAQPSTHSRVSIFISERFWLALIFAVGASLRLYGLEFQSLWYDEGLQYYIATHNSIRELFGQSRSFHPPLSFIINYIFLLFGDSDFLLRLPSALFGIASLPVLYILARDLTSKQTAILAIFVMALSPFHIWYSQEGRMYSQLIFLSLLSSVLLLQALRYSKISWWIYYTIVGAMGMYTHVFMGLSIAAQFLWILVYRRSVLLLVTASGLVISLVFLPWALVLPWMRHFAHGVSTHGLAVGLGPDGRAGFTWGAVPYTLFVYGAGFSLGPSVAELHADKSIALILTFLPSIMLVTLVFALLLWVGVVLMIKRFGIRTACFCALGFLVPLVGTAVYSLTPHATFNVRYTVTAFPYFCIFVGTAVALLTRAHRILGVVAILALVGISVASLYNNFTDPRYAKEDFRSAVAFWQQTANEEPLLAVDSIYPAQRYVGTPGMTRFFLVGGDDIVQEIEQVFSNQNTSSAYVVLARDWDKSRERTIRNDFGGILERSFPGVKVFRISRQAPYQMRDPAGAQHRTHQVTAVR